MMFFLRLQPNRISHGFVRYSAQWSSGFCRVEVISIYFWAVKGSGDRLRMNRIYSCRAYHVLTDTVSECEMII